MRLSTLTVDEIDNLLTGLHEVEVAIHHAFDVGRIRDDRQHLAEVELMEVDSDVLQRLGIVVVAVYLDTHAVVGTQFHVGPHSPVITEVDIVAVIDSELLIAQDWFIAEEVQAHSVVVDAGHQSHANTETALCIVDAGLHPGAVLRDGTVEERMEHIGGIIGFVLHLKVVRHCPVIGR